MADLTIKTDDLDGTHYAATVEFHDADGTKYTIDLADKNAAVLRDAQDDYRAALARFVEKARPADGKRKRSATSGRKRNTGGNSETARIREWAREQGMEVPERGTLPSSVRDAYRDAHDAAKTGEEEPPVDQSL